MAILRTSNGVDVLVDDEDLERLTPFKWNAYLKKGIGCVVTFQSGNRIVLHRMLANTPVGFITDHKNGNPLDNRKENLRICNYSQNNANCKKHGSSCASKYKGVTYRKNRLKWGARIKKDGREVWLGSYRNEEIAAIAFDLGSIEHHGEFARPNFLSVDVMIDFDLSIFP